MPSRYDSMGHELLSEEEMRWAILWDLIGQKFPNLMEGADDPREFSRRLREARQALVQERIDALYHELKDQPKFIYRAYGEVYVGLVWSKEENRFVRIYAGQ